MERQLRPRRGDNLLLLGAGELAENRLRHSGGVLDGQGVHEHVRCGRHGGGWGSDEHAVRLCAGWGCCCVGVRLPCQTRGQWRDKSLSWSDPGPGRGGGRQWQDVWERGRGSWEELQKREKKKAVALARRQDSSWCLSAEAARYRRCDSASFGRVNRCAATPADDDALDLQIGRLAD